MRTLAFFYNNDAVSTLSDHVRLAADDYAQGKSLYMRAVMRLVLISTAEEYRAEITKVYGCPSAMAESAGIPPSTFTFYRRLWELVLKSGISLETAREMMEVSVRGLRVILESLYDYSGDKPKPMTEKLLSVLGEEASVDDFVDKILTDVREGNLKRRAIPSHIADVLSASRVTVTPSRDDDLPVLGTVVVEEYDKDGIPVNHRIYLIILKDTENPNNELFKDVPIGQIRAKLNL